MAPSKQGRDPKAKPWRKGKSKNANKKGSIKSQIRSKLRLLGKIADDSIKEKLKIEISQLEAQRNSNKKLELERKLASKYHQVKFFERQKLTRLEKKVQKRLDDARAAADFEDVENYTRQLEQVCMDQLYVAYYPNDEKYIALFGNGIRLIDDEKIQKKREKIRQQIINRIKNGEINCKKSWVNMRVLQAKNFDVDMTNLILSEDNADQSKVDSQRFKSKFVVSKNEINQNDRKIDHDSADGYRYDLSAGARDGVDSDSSKEEPEIMRESKAKKDEVPTVGFSDSSRSDSSSSDSSTSDSDDSSESSSDSHDSDLEKLQDILPDRYDNEDSEDDFLMDDLGDGDIKDVFNNAKREANYEKKGDKSLGWKTQKQQPSAWKRSRTR